MKFKTRILFSSSSSSSSSVEHLIENTRDVGLLNDFFSLLSADWPA